jgi:DNA transposition AAA+ family ATPase
MTDNIAKLHEDEADWIVAVRAEINRMIEAREVSAAQITREASVNQSALSQFRNNKYPGRNEVIAERLKTWLETFAKRQEATKKIATGPGFVLTHTAERVMDSLTYAHMAGDIVLIYGGAGVGKTEALREYARSNSGVCLSTMTPAHATVATSLREIGKCVGVQPRRDNATMFDAICSALADQRGLLIIDEAQHLGAKALDQVRSIHDRIGCGIALVGNEQVYGRMSGGTRAEYLDRLYSRIGMRTRLGRATEADAKALAKAWKIGDATSAKLLVNIARKPGGLRGVTKTLLLAGMFTEDKIEPKHIRAAWKRLAGEVAA